MLAFNAAAQKVPDSEAGPVWETVAHSGEEISQENWAQVPSDLSRNLDRHLDGTTKVPDTQKTS
jgi:hypothetical protein